jgi:D-glycerate 3-kinase
MVRLTTSEMLLTMPDFYLDYRGLKSLAQEYPDNEMLQGRGPPGTHDIPLLKSVLGSVTKINDSATSSVDLPSFDKSQHSGFGDRSPTPIPLKGPIDIFILEGWSLGFEPRDSETLKQLHQQGRTAKKHSFSIIDQINQNLITFAGEINNRFDTHISIFPKSYNYVYKWRLQQEHHMKSGNGGKGMTDEEVEKFVDRYMPAYELYKGTDGRCGGLRLVFGEEREVLSVEELTRH